MKECFKFTKSEKGGEPDTWVMEVGLKVVIEKDEGDVDQYQVTVRTPDGLRISERITASSEIVAERIAENTLSHELRNISDRLSGSRIVQLLVYKDELIGLTADGKIVRQVHAVMDWLGPK